MKYTFPSVYFVFAQEIYLPHLAFLNFNKYARIHVFDHCVKNIFCASVEEQAVAKVLSLT